MRNAFVDALAEIAEKDPRIVLLTGDLGYMVLSLSQSGCPDAS